VCGTICRLEQRAFHRRSSNLNARQRKFIMSSRAAQIDSLRSPPFLPPANPATGFRASGREEKGGAKARNGLLRRRRSKKRPFLPGPDGLLQQKFRAISSQTLQLSQTHHYLPEPCPVTLGMFDPDGKAWERPPGSDHSRRSPAFARGLELKPFSASGR
jgi:hypothetical protein